MNLLTTSALIASCLFGASAVASNDGTSGTEKSAVSGHRTMQVPLAEGLVKQIDRRAGTITLSHGPLPNGMPAMAMDYRLKEVSWFDQLKVGQRIRFAVAEVGGEFAVVRLEPLK